MALETEILQAFYQLRHPIMNEFFMSLTVLGSSVFALVLLTGLYLSDEKELSRKAFWAYGLNTAITWSLKRFFNRPRPDIGQPLVENVFNFSFPSGHTSTAFMLATVLAWRKPEARIYFFSLAALVGLSRLYLGVHYPSDVLAGAIIGILSATAVIKRKDMMEHVRR